MSDFQAGGPPQRVLDAEGLGVAADLLRLTADEVTDRESVDTDALYAAATYYTRGLSPGRTS
ncbi:hypothetical protein [Micromonospora sp. ATA51]|uniref:hypothetical protein n=1 Tax=Micromonospora sp. ATA51 TaxID=2806098 RepID=UPI001A3637EE|nr:hypothetical protein [Micromonospora sp. ATA51]MBM0224393.1 hypothetical protein [Micromonospora sp. ATA51]